MSHPYIPGKALILSRLPAQDWFTPDEAADASGWGVTYIRDRIKDGTLVAQQWQGQPEQRAGGGGVHNTYRIHVDDLVLFILLNGRGRYGEAKPIQDIIAIVRTWPRWLLSHLHAAIGQILSKPGTSASTSGHEGKQPSKPGTASPAGAGDATSS
jgi:hypothetical protein